MGRLCRAAGALAAILMLACATAAPAVATQPGIVGGEDADEPYPFIVSLQLSSGEHFCGASLVTPDSVLTAAHCVQGREPAEVTARIGSNDRTAGGETRRAAGFVVHRAYDPDGAGADIALVRLAEPATPAPIPLGSDTSAGTATRILGWGQTCPAEGCGQSPVTLQQLDTSIVDGSRCESAFDHAAELCTDNPGGDSGACYGDSGGPEIARVDGTWRLLGVSSRPGNDDAKCATAPSIYTSAVAYGTWITSHTRE